MLSCESRCPLSWPGVVAAVSNERGGDEHMRSRSKLLQSRTSKLDNWSRGRTADRNAAISTALNSARRKESNTPTVVIFPRVSGVKPNFGPFSQNFFSCLSVNSTLACSVETSQWKFPELSDTIEGRLDVGRSAWPDRFPTHRVMARCPGSVAPSPEFRDSLSASKLFV